MKPRTPGLGRLPSLGLMAAALLLVGGCSSLTVPQRNQLIGAAMIGGLSVNPSADVEQVYYLGSFDPRSQFPPSVYRIRVRGQSSILNLTRFASSWVPSEVVDALTGHIQMNLGNGRVSLEKADDVKLSTGRGLVMFGPEGVREAPRGHRLVIIMGSSPETVEQAFASALGSVAKARFGESGAGLDKTLFDLLLSLGRERDQLKSLAEPS